MSKVDLKRLRQLDRLNGEEKERQESAIADWISGATPQEIYRFQPILATYQGPHKKTFQATVASRKSLIPIRIQTQETIVNGHYQLIKNNYTFDHEFILKILALLEYIGGGIITLLIVNFMSGDYPQKQTVQTVLIISIIFTGLGLVILIVYTKGVPRILQCFECCRYQGLIEEEREILWQDLQFQETRVIL